MAHLIRRACEIQPLNGARCGELRDTRGCIAWKRQKATIASRPLARWFVDWLGGVAVVGGDNAAELLVAAESGVRSWAEGSLQDLGLNARARFGRPSGQRVARTS